jgi:hypothetical protein
VLVETSEVSKTSEVWKIWRAEPRSSLTLPCHSERSEESRFFVAALLRMTAVLRVTPQNDSHIACGGARVPEQTERAAT